MSRYKRPLRLCILLRIMKRVTITVKKTMNLHQETQEYTKGKSPLISLSKIVKIMIFNVGRSQCFISLTKSHSLVRK